MNRSRSVSRTIVSRGCPVWRARISWFIPTMSSPPFISLVDSGGVAPEAAGRVDVQADVLLRVLGLQEQELGDDQVREVVLDLVADEDDPFLQQPRVDVVGALSAAGGLDDHRNEHVGGPG